ncbi:RusA family crossover junction endodeoxyribonuclease [Limosilactobacillus mucosae]|uniref:RusA family crossover junction endodeoxyribonuclease n=1 Tax=Limosilactobacillus mucosae TaxID=97478 RepID=UPI00233E6C9A|nr:RusA family crossover junction endodeoxyribonuclease [Limosilactobacillus mucosae]MDC2841626.1 RusA family crossover junction endodeoxyribonuclease [Limosilactobacillus mucosae]
MIKLILPIEPVAQARPRARRFGRGIRLYDPPKTAVFKKQLRALATEMYHDAPVEGEIYLKVAFYRKIQKSISKKEHDRRASGAHRPIVKADLSNYLKSFEDALNGVLWKDDAMIVHEEIDKYYSDKPRIEVEIYAKNGETKYFGGFSRNHD